MFEQRNGIRGRFPSNIPVLRYRRSPKSRDGKRGRIFRGEVFRDKSEREARRALERGPMALFGLVSLLMLTVIFLISYYWGVDLLLVCLYCIVCKSVYIKVIRCRPRLFKAANYD